MSRPVKNPASFWFTALATLLTFPGTILAAPVSPAEPPTAQAQAKPTTEQANPQTPLVSPQEAVTSPPADSQAQRDENFKKLVTNVRLVGNFTMDGDTDPGKLRR